MSHHETWQAIEKDGFLGFGGEEAILGFVLGTFMSHRVLRGGGGGSRSYAVTTNSPSARFSAMIPIQGATALPAEPQPAWDNADNPRPSSQWPIGRRRTRSRVGSTITTAPCSSA